MCTRGRNGRDGKAEYYYVEEEYNNIFIFFVSVLAMTTTRFPFRPFSVSSVIYINIGGRTENYRVGSAADSCCFLSVRV